MTNGIFHGEKLNLRFEVDSLNLVPYTLEMVFKYYSVYCHSGYISKILDSSIPHL